MYTFPHFKENNSQAILDFIHEHPFAFLTGSYMSGEQVATQIPILMEEREGEMYLQGHFMRNTDHHKAFIENPNALVVFTGPHAYVSASWYTDAPNASTWNYMSVHIRGKMSFMSRDAFIQFMQKFTLRFEGGNEHSSTIYDQLPDSYLRKMMPAIIGFELKVENIEHVFKLSQNKDDESYFNIVSKLEERGGNSALVAKEMKKRKPKGTSNITL